MNKKVLKVVLVLILLVNVIIILNLFKGADSVIESYLKQKYGIDKSQYTLGNVTDGGIAKTYHMTDKNGNKFEVKNYGSNVKPNFMDNYQQHVLEQDILKEISKHISSKITYISTTDALDTFGGIKKVYNGNVADYIENSDYLKNWRYSLYPIKVWIAANDKNNKEILSDVKKNIRNASDALGCGLKVYVVKDTVTDYSKIDYTWNEENTYSASIKYLKDAFYYVVLYNKRGDYNFIINAKTDDKDYYWGE